MKTAVWWIRRDLRLDDNPALEETLARAERIVPLFVIDPALWHSPYVGDKRRAFLLEGLRALDGDLRARGARLVVRRGDPAEELAAVVAGTGAGAIVAQDDVSPYARRRAARLAGAQPLPLTGGLTIHPPAAVRKHDGGPYQVYGAYRRTWLALPLPDAADLIPAPEALPMAEAAGIPLPESPARPDSVPFVAGEAEALRRLENFAAGPIADYDEQRDRLDTDATSRLSPYLRFGKLSPRRAAVAAVEARRSAAAEQGASTWLDELIWREFFHAILHNFPRVRRESFRAAYRDLSWRADPEGLAAWREGRTGYPVVDAGMRQLLATGWMHNRARMVVGSFLTKDLLIDWREGEQHFMQHLLDGDPALNNGNWQWVAGTGTDAVPYFRIFNPVRQSEAHDPEGAYVRRWVPELRDVPDAYVHTPWTMPEATQREAGCVVGKDYPAPIVDHQAARKRALAAYQESRAEGID